MAVHNHLELQATGKTFTHVAFENKELKIVSFKIVLTILKLEEKGERRQKSVIQTVQAPFTQPPLSREKEHWVGGGGQRMRINELCWA